MKLLSKFILVPVSAIVISSVTLSAQSSTDPEDYKLLALKNCNVVMEASLTEEQLSAYLLLKNEEKLMSGLEQPLKGMEEQLKEFTDRIEEVTALAVQETDDSIYIDKYYLKEQQDLAESIDEIVTAHQLDIDALEEQGSRIGEKARVFEAAIEEGLEDVDYDQIRIITPDSDDEHYSCNKSIVITRR